MKEELKKVLALVREGYRDQSYHSSLASAELVEAIRRLEKMVAELEAPPPPSSSGR